jgi:amino acid adenylation domain-containing protein
LTERLREVSRREGVTLFMTLLAGFQVLLSRYSNQSDVAVGSPVANRNRLEVEPLIGFFVNTLVLRADLSADQTFAELLGRVRGTVLDAYAHQDLPFEKLVEELQPERDLSRTPLFQALFAFQNAAAEEMRLPGLRLKEFDTSEQQAKFELSLLLAELPTGLSGVLDYSSELFSAETARRILSHLRTVLDAVAADPGQRISDLPLLGEDEKRQLLFEFNDTARAYTDRRCVHQLFETRAEVAPDAVAVVDGERRLTYRQLDEAANQLAHYLKGAGVSLESRVAVCMGRSAEMIVALLGTLKAGATYLPIDPVYPAERIQAMLDDSRCAVLLTERGLGHSFDGVGGRVVYVDESREEFAKQSADSPRVAVLPESLAYVIYTSGSTGRPKGVMVSHAALLNLVRWHEAAYALTTGDRTTQLSSLSFDASVWEIWPTLACGASLYLADGEVRLEPFRLSEWLAAEEINVSFIPTPVAELLLRQEWPRATALRALLTGGDKLHHGPPRGASFTLFNHYGPTENAVVATCVAVEGDDSGATAPPIGRPITNTQVYLLDARMRLAPSNVAGEIYIGGESLARGYLDEPGLTAERFVPNPFSAEPGTRLYRTGDLARWNADGNLEFLGRSDHQVKLRGFRIELGDIESHLRQHPSVGEAVVLLREDEPGEKRLVAYTVAAGRQQAAEAELREYLRGRLPDYMVPAHFVMLDSLPLTTNGKLDRKALPKPEVSSPAQAFASADSPAEEIICGIYTDVLKVERVSAGESFFESGGHSLLATQVVSRIREAFGVELPLRALFEHPSAAALAKEVERARSAGDVVKAPSLVPAPRTSPLPLSFAQQRLWFIDQLEPGSTAYNVPFALRLTGALDLSALRRALDEIVRRHEILHTCFPSENGQPVQLVFEPRPLPLEEIDLSHLEESEREERAQLLARTEAEREPFNLSTGPLIRARRLRLAEDRHVLLLTMHHIVSDGWSVGILVREFSALYEAFRAGHPSPLPELTLQYADFAVWQREWLRGEVLERQLGYWREQLEGVPDLGLPTDFVRPTASNSRGEVVNFSIPAALTQELKALCRQQGVTLFMALLGGFQVLLSRYANQRDVAVGTSIANRNRIETEGMIGYFINQLVLRCRLRDELPVTEFLAQVRRTVLDAYAHQDTPFDRLVEELRPGRAPGRAPLFQVLFVFQNATQGGLRLPGLAVEEMEAGSASTKFDLTMFMGEDGDGLAGAIHYSPELFRASTVERLLRHYLLVLEQICGEPSAPLSGLSLLDDSRRGEIAAAFADDLDSMEV